MPAEEFVELVAGCRVRIMRKGSGAPLLFLPGVAGVPTWLPFMNRLAEQFEVWVPEHPGFGGSELPTWLESISDLAFYYQDFIEHLRLAAMHLAGASLGGWIACEIAVRNTEMLRSLTLVAPAGLREPDVCAVDILNLSPAEMLQMQFHNPASARKAAERGHGPSLETLFGNRQAMARLAGEPRLHNPHLHKWLHRIDVPTMVVWGQEDRLLPAVHGQAFAELIPGARLQVIAECGHLPHVEQFETTAAAMRSFIGPMDGRRYTSVVQT